MKVLITGGIGFVGCKIIEFLRNNHPSFEVIAIDNLSRKGCQLNLTKLNRIDAKFLHCDIRSRSDVESIPKADWVIDCAANPSVLAGLNHSSSSLQLMENNLVGTLNLIEYCKRHNAGLILLSTSRVYSAAKLSRFQSLKKKPDFPLMLQSSAKDFLKKGSPKNFQQPPPCPCMEPPKSPPNYWLWNTALVLTSPFGLTDVASWQAQVNSEKRIRELFRIGYIPSMRPNRSHTLDSQAVVCKSETLCIRKTLLLF